MPTERTHTSTTAAASVSCCRLHTKICKTRGASRINPIVSSVAPIPFAEILTMDPGDTMPEEPKPALLFTEVIPEMGWVTFEFV